MGIRFYCPNGHKVNVKDFLAGQKGLCPVCGTPMQIPLESTRASSKRAKNRSKHHKSAVSADDATAPLPTSSSSETGPDAADPLAEAGDVVWYVRPAAGGQFGPAVADVMRSWLREGRIGADTLVWREGWRDWREAGQVFPQLSPRKATPAPKAVGPPPIPAAPSIADVMKHRSRTRNTQATVVGALSIIVIVLFAVLFLVLKH